MSDLTPVCLLIRPRRKTNPGSQQKSHCCFYHHQCMFFRPLIFDTLGSSWHTSCRMNENSKTKEVCYSGFPQKPYYFVPPTYAHLTMVDDLWHPLGSWPYGTILVLFGLRSQERNSTDSETILSLWLKLNNDSNKVSKVNKRMYPLDHFKHKSNER